MGADFFKIAKAYKFTTELVENKRLGKITDIQCRELSYMAVNGKLEEAKVCLQNLINKKTEN